MKYVSYFLEFVLSLELSQSYSFYFIRENLVVLISAGLFGPAGFLCWQVYYS